MVESQIAEAAVAIGALEKDGQNDQQGGYRYLSEKAVKAAVRQHVYGRGMAPDLRVEIISDEWHPYGRQGHMANFVKMKCSIDVLDGHVTRHGEGLGAGVDYADKATMKAQTVAVREAWKNLLGITDGQDSEADPVGDEGPAPRETRKEPEEQRDAIPYGGKNCGRLIADLDTQALEWYAEKADHDWVRDACTQELLKRTDDG